MAQKIMVGMSGGVDSSVAAYLLKKQGYEVTGVTFKLWDDPTLESGCCSADDVRDAAYVCQQLGIPHYVLNYKDLFRQEVVGPFAEEYLRGRTPNPCISCNRYIKFGAFSHKLRELGFDHTVLHNPLHFDRYRQLGTTTPRDYAALFARIAKGELVSREASAEMLAILRQQHYNTMLTHDFPQYYLDCEETGAPELIWVASKSGSMNACRNDGGIVHTPYGEYVIVLMNKDFHDIIEYNEHPAMVYGARVSRMILDQVLACEGRLSLS